MLVNTQFCEQLLELAGILAASLVLVSLIHQFNLASALIQISWIGISVVGVFRLWSTNRRRDSRKRRKTNRKSRRRYSAKLI